MEVEFTARQVKISKALRMQAEEGMERIARILGKTARASLIFGAQRHTQIVEITVQVRMQTFAAAGKGDTLDGALKQAIEHALNQDRRYRDKRLEGREGANSTSGSAAQGASAFRRRDWETDSSQGPSLHRHTLLSQQGHCGRAAYSQERRSHFTEAHDH